MCTEGPIRGHKHPTWSVNAHKPVGFPQACLLSIEDGAGSVCVPQTAKATEIRVLNFPPLTITRISSMLSNGNRQRTHPRRWRIFGSWQLYHVHKCPQEQPHLKGRYTCESIVNEVLDLREFKWTTGRGESHTLATLGPRGEYFIGECRRDPSATENHSWAISS